MQTIQKFWKSIGAAPVQRTSLELFLRNQPMLLVLKLEIQKFIEFISFLLFFCLVQVIADATTTRQFFKKKKITTDELKFMGFKFGEITVQADSKEAGL